MKEQQQQNVSTELKETMRSMRAISHKMENIDKEDIIKKKQVEILKLKSVIIEMKKQIARGAQQQIGAVRRKNQKV